MRSGSAQLIPLHPLLKAKKKALPRFLRLSLHHLKLVPGFDQNEIYVCLVLLLQGMCKFLSDWSPTSPHWQRSDRVMAAAEHWSMGVPMLVLRSWS